MGEETQKTKTGKLPSQREIRTPNPEIAGTPPHARMHTPTHTPHTLLREGRRAQAHNLIPTALKTFINPFSAGMLLLPTKQPPTFS